MADRHFSVQIKRGTEKELESVPDLLPGELVWITDTRSLYIGTDHGNELIASHQDIEDLTNESGSSLGQVLKDWNIKIEEFKEILKTEVVSSFASNPYYIGNTNEDEIIRTGLISVDNNTLNLPDGFNV